MPKSLGRQQIAECPRCGGKVPASSLQYDGRLKKLLVCPTCWDPEQPQEHPFVPLDTEGLAPFPIAPEQLPASANPVLTLVSAEAPVSISWTTGDTSRYIIVAHWIYRASGTAGPFSLLRATPYIPGTAPDYAPFYDTEYIDSETEQDMQYRYRVDAITDQGEHLASNVLLVDTTIPYEPPGPVELSGEIIGGDGVFASSLTWTESTGGSDPIAYYLLYRGVDGATPELYQTLGPDELSFEETISADTAYAYVVYAQDEHEGISPPSNTVTLEYLSGSPQLSYHQFAAFDFEISPANFLVTFRGDGQLLATCLNNPFADVWNDDEPIAPGDDWLVPNEWWSNPGVGNPGALYDVRINTVPGYLPPTGADGTQVADTWYRLDTNPQFACSITYEPMNIAGWFVEIRDAVTLEIVASDYIDLVYTAG